MMREDGAPRTEGRPTKITRDKEGGVRVWKLKHVGVCKKEGKPQDGAYPSSGKSPHPLQADKR